MSDTFLFAEIFLVSFLVSVCVWLVLLLAFALLAAPRRREAELDLQYRRAAEAESLRIDAGDVDMAGALSRVERWYVGGELATAEYCWWVDHLFSKPDATWRLESSAQAREVVWREVAARAQELELGGEVSTVCPQDTTGWTIVARPGEAPLWVRRRERG